MDTTYLVECFWPGVTREVITAASERARESAVAQCREGRRRGFRRIDAGSGRRGGLLPIHGRLGRRRHSDSACGRLAVRPGVRIAVARTRSGVDNDQGGIMRLIPMVIGLFGLFAIDVTVHAEEPREGTCDLAEELFPDHNPGPGSLKEIAVPEPTNLRTYVRNRDVAIALGKALFWDMQVGSDGVQACASCHFRGGADPRSVNQLNPGGQDNSDPTIDLGGPNYRLKGTDFPLHMLADPTDRTSTVLRNIDDVVSSQGVHLRQFVRAEPGATRDETIVVSDPVFNIQGINTRRAEPRNTPTIINAALTLENFWDRRAANIFNGVSVQGVG